MSTAKCFTNFPIITFPTKFKPLKISPSSSLSFRHCCFSLKTPFSCDFISGKYPLPRIKIGIRRKTRLMGERVLKIGALGSEDGEENLSVLEQEGLISGSSKFGSNFVSLDFEATVNKLSKWLIAVLFGVVLLWRHDAEAVWAAMGSIFNSALSVVLKKILNQERPVANLRSDPGMPSSHAQSIFFAVVFVILTVVEWLGVNEITAVFAAVSLAFGSYLSWLRVAQKLHTVDQVVVGAVLGSCFSVAWLWSWSVAVSEAFDSYVWVQVSIVLASALCCTAFLVYVVLNWFQTDR